jgi:ATP-dependent DNA ligase
VVRGGAEVPATAPSSFYLPQKGSECRSAGKEEPGAGRALYRRVTPLRTGFVDKIDRERHIREVTLPRVQPIIPTRRKEPFDDPDWLFDFKYDGFRALCYIERGPCRFISRNGNVLSRFDALADQAGRLLDVDEGIIDGEVIAADKTGRPQFYELLRVPRSASYVAFDLLWLNGTDLRALPLSERRRRLQSILPKGSPIVSEALSVEGRGRELFELMCDNELEGIVAKRLADPYDSRIRWLKIKNPDYSQKEGRGDLFNGPRQRTTRTAG